MRAFCSSCKQIIDVKKLRGRAPCCSAWNSLTKLPKVRERQEKGKHAQPGMS